MATRQDGFVHILVIVFIALFILTVSAFIAFRVYDANSPDHVAKCTKSTCGSMPKVTANTSSLKPETTTTHLNYISAGDVPASGLQVGVTFYGALEESQNGTYIVSNLLQGGQKNGGKYDGFDDNGEGACGGKYANLTNQSTWAEDRMGTALGNLPCGTKLALSYHGRTVIAERGDISNGGCKDGQATCYDNGVERKVDIWWQTAKALCLSDQPSVIKVHAVPESTPTTIIEPYRADSPSSYSVCQ